MGFAYQRDEAFPLCVLMVRADSELHDQAALRRQQDSAARRALRRGDAIGLPQDLRLRYPADDAHCRGDHAHCPWNSDTAAR